MYIAAILSTDEHAGLRIGCSYMTEIGRLMTVIGTWHINHIFCANSKVITAKIWFHVKLEMSKFI